MIDVEHQDDMLIMCQANTSDLVGHKFDEYASHGLSPARLWCKLVHS